MQVRVDVTDDPVEAHEAAATLLRRRPVEHNVILTLLADRIATGTPGRCWWATADGTVDGFVLRSPREYYASIVPMDGSTVDALADAVHADGTPLPGVIGEAATAARFAGRWTERTGAGARPREGQRLYRLGTLTEPTGPPGQLRLARPDDAELLTKWAEGFERDTDMPSPGDLRGMIEARIAGGRIWVWEDDDGPACMAVGTVAVEGVARVGFVYTPDARRNRGYAAVCVGRLSRHLLDTEADICILTTQLANPTSNGVYRRLGYEAVAELLTYDLSC